jgi:hypothetical protein
MKITAIFGFWISLVLASGLVTTSISFAADQTPTATAGKQSLEMPVMTGAEWQQLGGEAKIAFIWGIGHVVTIEEHVVQRHPELAKPDFPTKLAEGLRGVQMNTIVEELDRYYRTHPADINLPVMKVIWRQLVKPKLSTGIANRPIDHEQEQ